MSPGPSSLLITLTRSQVTEELARRLAQAGVSGVCLIAKGYKPAEYLKDYETLKRVGVQLHEEFEVIVDLPGGKPRIGSTVEDFVVERGERLMLQPDQALHPASPGVSSVGTVGLMPFVTSLRPGHRVLVSDGSIELRVIDIGRDYVLVEVETDLGTVAASRSINLPDSRVRYMSRGDDDGTLVAFERDCELDVAVSMVAGALDVSRVRQMLPNARVIAKIETQFGLDNLEKIAEQADELLIARGDLSIELPVERIGLAADAIMDAAKAHGCSYIVAAGFLESLERRDRPTTAEVSDLWHFHRLGTRRFLLSGAVCVTNPLEVTRWARRLLDTFDKVAEPARQ
jgi:pyruvate kinase